MGFAYIGLGSNLGNRERYLQVALEQMSEHPAIMVRNVSSIYETAPVGVTEQPAFLNMVAEINTTLSPIELLDYTQFIEEHCGRTREIKWGPRTLDLDILLYNHENMKSERLEIPHPRMKERGFVLIPLFEVNARLVSELFAKEYKSVQQLFGQDIKLWKHKNDFWPVRSFIKR